MTIKVMSEPMLIATGETEENATNDLPDYENYTGDMLISPGPEANSDAMTPLHLPISGHYWSGYCYSGRDDWNNHQTEEKIELRLPPLFFLLFLSKTYPQKRKH